jgi:hypothetical protein
LRPLFGGFFGGFLGFLTTQLPCKPAAKPTISAELDNTVNICAMARLA